MVGRSFVALLSFAVIASGSVIETRQTCNTYTVAGLPGGFTKKTVVDFSGVKSTDNASSFLSQHGFYVSGYTVGDTPIQHQFTPNNVYFGNGVLNLRVNKYSGSGPTQCAEFATTEQFKYASVRTVSKSSKVPGVCEGNFFYRSDNQEIDWEILTSTSLKSSAQVPAGIWATNQATTPGGQSTHTTVPFTFDPTADFHEYRVDWTADASRFYIDGQLKTTLTSNVPTTAGSWIWNVWSNGDPNWSAGPPTADSITQIRSIELLTGYTSTVQGTACSA